MSSQSKIHSEFKPKLYKETLSQTNKYMNHRKKEMCDWILKGQIHPSSISPRQGSELGFFILFCLRQSLPL